MRQIHTYNDAHAAVVAFLGPEVTDDPDYADTLEETGTPAYVTAASSLLLMRVAQRLCDLGIITTAAGKSNAQRFALAEHIQQTQRS